MKAASSSCPRCGGINCTFYPNGYMFCTSCSHSWPRTSQHPVTPTPPSSFPVFPGSPAIPSYGSGTPLISYDATGGGMPQLPLPPYATVPVTPPVQQSHSSGPDPQSCPKCKGKYYWRADGNMMRCMGCNSPYDPDGKIAKARLPKTFKCPSCKRTKPVSQKEYGTSICRVCADD